MKKSGNFEKSKSKKKPILVTGLIIVLCGIAAIMLFGMDLIHPKEEEQVTPPWEMGGKAPAEYTWDEFEALEGVQKDLFFDTFESAEAFEVWMLQAGGPAHQVTEAQEKPWETGGKAPEDYTWEEYQALSPELQEAFFESFESAEAFDVWRAAVGGLVLQTDPVPEYPWEQGDKKPEAYTWEEFLNLPEEQKDPFVESFGSMEAFENWQNRVNPEPTAEATVDNTVEQITWDNGGKEPDQYTWEEFLALSPEDQEAFFLSFATPEDFEAWMKTVSPE